LNPSLRSDKENDGTDERKYMSKTLDARGYNCPIPVLKARKALQGLNAGELITVLATDPASFIDIPHFCNTTGHQLVASTDTDGVYTYTIRKAG
jgi:tRNA 2-thiouridine synthesizing protein A